VNLLQYGTCHGNASVGPRAVLLHCEHRLSRLCLLHRGKGPRRVNKISPKVQTKNQTSFFHCRFFYLYLYKFIDYFYFILLRYFSTRACVESHLVIITSCPTPLSTVRRVRSFEERIRSLFSLLFFFFIPEKQSNLSGSSFY